MPRQMNQTTAGFPLSNFPCVFPCCFLLNAPKTLSANSSCFSSVPRGALWQEHELKCEVWDSQWFRARLWQFPSLTVLPLSTRCTSACFSAQLSVLQPKPSS